jgi:predicted SprT family Zn-dependent metalloprotease
MTNQLLLSAELRAKVDAVVEQSFCACEKHYKQKFNRPEIRYNIRNTNGGEAWHQQNLIRLNLTFLVENEEDFLEQTVPHEVAHLVAHAVYDSKPMNGKKVRPHGPEWKEVCGVLGIKPRVKHTYNLTSLDLVRVKRVRATKTTKGKLLDLVKRLGKLEENERLELYSMLRNEGML